MSKSPDSVAKFYDQLQPAERATLVLKAMARGDRAEADRLGSSCPRRFYRGADDAFVERLAMSFDAMAGACVDLSHASGKLFVLKLLIEMLNRLMATHHVNATLAFFEGRRQARGEPPMLHYADRPLDAGEPFAEADAPGEEGHDADEEDGDETEGGIADDLTDAELARRLEAVERQAAAATDWLRGVMTGMADGVAQPFVEQFEAFDRFAQGRLGLDGRTLMRAWGFPGADDLAATLLAYKHVQPREEEVAELVAVMAEAWKRRLERDLDPSEQG